MEVLVVMFIMFVLSKLFGGITQQPQDQRRKVGRPFPNMPSEWNFPRQGDILNEEPEMVPAEAPQPKKTIKEVEQGKKPKQITKKPEKVLEEDESRGNLIGNLLAPDNIMSGIILAEVLNPPKSKRGTR